MLNSQFEQLLQLLWTSAALVQRLGTVLRVALLPTVAGGSGTTDGRQRSRFAAAFASQLIIKFEFMQSGFGFLRKRIIDLGKA